MKNHHLSNLLYPLLLIAGLLLAAQVCQAPIPAHNHQEAMFPYPGKMDTLRSEIHVGADTLWADDHRYIYDYFMNRMIIPKPNSGE